MEWTRERVDTMRAGRPVHGAKDKAGTLTWLCTGKDTNGEYSLMYFELGPGYKLPAHYHTAFTETFNIVDGYLPGLRGDQKITAKPGDSVVIPPRTVHGWGPLEEGEVNAVVEIRSAHESFEKWVTIIHNLFAEGDASLKMTPKNFVYIALAGIEMDTRTAGPAGLLYPIEKVVAWCARKAGVDRRLEEKYAHPSTGDVATAI